VNRDTAVREIARCFLAGAGMTIPGELARVTGLSRSEAGRGNRALVAEGYATMPKPGFYKLSGSPVFMALPDHSCRMPVEMPKQ
jgi:DNA-binding IclR family transcriptional regulator